MGDKRKEIRNSRRGMTLVLAVVIVLVLTLIGTGLLQLGRNARLQAVRDVLQISARSAADAGIEHAVRYMISGWSDTADKLAWVASWDDPTVWTDPATPATGLGYPFGPVSLDGTYGDASFTYDIYKGEKTTGYQIISTGIAGGRARIVHAAVVLRSAFFGIGAKDNITIDNNAGLGTIPEDGDFLLMTLSTGKPPSEGIMLRNGVIVPGNITVGYGGDPEEGIVEKKDVIIEGEADAADDVITFDSVTAPSLPPGTWEEDLSDPNIVTISSDGEFANLLLGATGDTHTTLYIVGDVTIYVSGQVILGASAELIVTLGSSLTLYLGDSLEAKNGSSITHEIIPDPLILPDHESEVEIAALSISIKGTETCDSIILKNSGDFYGSIYAPDAYVEIRNSGDFYGALIGGGQLKLYNSGNFIFVTALYELGDVEVLYMGIKKGSWWEE